MDKLILNRLSILTIWIFGLIIFSGCRHSLSSDELRNQSTTTNAQNLIEKKPLVDDTPIINSSESNQASSEQVLKTEPISAIPEQAAPTETKNLPTPTQSSIIWSAGHETGDLSEWESHGGFVRQGSSGMFRLVSPHAHSGQYSVALSIDTLAPTETGAHAAYLFFWEQLPGDTYYYSAWYYIPSEIKLDSWWNIWQWKSTNGGNSDYSKPMFSLGVETRDDKDFLTLNYRPDTPEKIVFKQSMMIVKDQWFQIEAKYVKSETEGQVIIWQDGVKIFEEEGLPTVLGDQTVYWSVNHYAESISPHPAIIYIDDAIISTSRIEP